MKKILFVLLWGLAISSYGQGAEPLQTEKEPAVRVYTTLQLGLGISSQSSEMTSGGAVLLAAVPLRFRHNWYLIPEFHGVGFRSPEFPEKRGIITSDYPRVSYSGYGLRAGKSFGPPNSGFSVLPTIGVSSLEVLDSYQDGTGFLGPIIKYNTIRTYAFPVEVDFQFQAKRESYAAFLMSGRWTKNRHRDFGSLSAGIKLDLDAAYQRRQLKINKRLEKRARRRMERANIGS